MKKSKALLVLMLSVIVAFAAAIPAMAATIGLRPTADYEFLLQGDIMCIPECGYQFEVELFFESRGDDLSAAGGIVGYTVDVLWDDLIGYQGFTGNNLYLMTDVTDSLPVKIELAGYNFADGITSDHVLGTFELLCLGEGLTDLISVGHFVDDINVAMADGYLTTDFEGLTIGQRCVVPIPSTLLLLGGGLVGLIGLKRRRRA